MLGIDLWTFERAFSALYFRAISTTPSFFFHLKAIILDSVFCTIFLHFQYSHVNPWGTYLKEITMCSCLNLGMFLKIWKQFSSITNIEYCWKFCFKLVFLTHMHSFGSEHKLTHIKKSPSIQYSRSIPVNNYKKTASCWVATAIKQ